MTLHLIRPWFLILIPMVLGSWLIWRKANDPLRGWREVIEPELLEALVMRTGKSRRGSLLLSAWLLAVLICAGPSWKPEPSPFSDDPSPVMILLKADESMNAEDVLPNRMERARLKAIDFAKLRNGRPTGLIAYAGSAHLVLPPTRDTDAAADMAAHISPTIMPEPGNDLSAAIRLAEQYMDGGSIVVITDSLPEFDSVKPVHILAVSRTDIRKAVQLTADSSDVETLDRRTRGTSTAVTEEGKVQRHESGYTFIPILGLFALMKFRRETA